MKKLILVAALIAAPSQATDWQFIGQSLDNRTKIYVDADSVKKSDDVGIAWVKLTDPAKPGYTLIYYGFKCMLRQFSAVRMIEFSAKGERSDYSDALDREWEPAAPDTLIYYAADYVCGDR